MVKLAKFLSLFFPLILFPLTGTEAAEEKKWSEAKLPIFYRDDPMDVVRAPSSYQLLGEAVGSGVSAIVWKAFDLSKLEDSFPRVTTLKAVKKFHSDRKDEEKHARVLSAGLTELKLLKAFNHPNVMNAHGAWIDDSGKEFHLHIAMDLMEMDLRSWIRKYFQVKLNPERADHRHLDYVKKEAPQIAKIYMYQLFLALRYLRSAKVIHRDIKPENIFINVSSNLLKVGDFGVAAHQPGPPKATAHVGTDIYMAPEIYSLSDDVDVEDEPYSFPVDMWAAGCILAEMYAGDGIFYEGTQNPPRRQLPKEQAAGTSKGYLKQLIPNLPDEALSLLDALLAQDPNKRPTPDQALAFPYFDSIRKYVHAKAVDYKVGPIDMSFDDRIDLDGPTLEKLITAEISRKR